MLRLGYCCINTELRKQGVYCSRTLIKRTFSRKQASEKALDNVKDLLTILKWNAHHNVKSFRISSDLFPRMTCKEHAYTFEQLPNHEEIASVLKECGQYAKKTDQQLSFHPGPFTTLASPNPNAVEGGIREVEMHSLFCDLLDPDMDIPINFHIGGSYKQTYEETAKRFINVYENRLSDSAKKRICIENDDKDSCWSTQRLYNFIHKKTGIPLCFDLHHWLFCHDDATMEEDFKLAQSTWGDRSMQVHYSESKNPDKLIRAHSYTYKNLIPEWVKGNIHIHFEAKGKEQALFDYMELSQGKHNNQIGGNETRTSKE